MLTSFVLSMALAAPVPPSTPPVASGPVPKLMELKADADGKITVTVMRTEKLKVTETIAGPNGAPITSIREVPVVKMVTVELGEVKDLKVTTADGKKVETADAVKTLKSGATVVVSTDGKPISPNHLKLFKDDVLVLVSPELTGPIGTSVGPKPLPGIRPAPQVLPAAPGIQIQIQPGQVQALPLVPAQPVPPPAPPKP